MDSRFIERVRQVRRMGGDWKDEVVYIANVLGQDELDVVVAAFGDYAYTEEDISEAYDDGFHEGFHEGHGAGYSDALADMEHS